MRYAFNNPNHTIPYCLTADNGIGSRKKISIKFHGVLVKNVIITLMKRTSDNVSTVERLDISNVKYEPNQNIEVINIQVVAEYVTITYYKDEAANVIASRELIPTHSIEHIMVSDI
ncbi:MAG TPA: hypothetical protein VE130_05350 [Nitrososphaeraceae archaeon]|jgi:hypothetical protein|nr:hypothetical protein [Nitrososphaeraceae archaeon]